MSEPELSTATATTEEPIAPTPSRNRLGVWGVIRWTGTNMSALWLLIAEIVIFTLLPATSATFPHVQIAQSVLDDVAIGALVAVGLIVPLAAGVFDLSVGYMVTAGSIVYSWIAIHSSLPPFVAILAVLGLSLVVAALNSIATVVLRIHSFIGTLAIGSILLAAIEYVTGNQDILNIPNRYVSLFGAPMLGETRGVYVVLGISIVIWWLTSLSNIGPRLYATGFNVDAARLAGVAVSKQMVLGFFVSAICATRQHRARRQHRLRQPDRRPQLSPLRFRRRVPGFDPDHPGPVQRLGHPARRRGPRRRNARSGARRRVVLGSRSLQRGRAASRGGAVGSGAAGARTCRRRGEIGLGPRAISIESVREMMALPQITDLEVWSRSDDIVRRFQERYRDVDGRDLSDLVHLEDPAFYVAPWAIYDRMRAEAPVYWYDQIRTWVLTRYDDIRQAARRPHLFSSEHGILLLDGVKVDAGLEDLFSETGEQLFLTDPPRHHELRRVMARPFTRTAIAALRPRIETIIDELLDAIVPGEPIDWAETVASILPIRVVCAILGLPDTDPDYIAQMRVWSDATETISTRDPSAAELVEAKAAFVSLNEHLAEMFAYKRSYPGDDFLTVLLADNLDDKKLSEANLVGFAQALITGTDTTRSLVAGFVAHMCEFPGQRQLLAKDPSLAANAMEEVLRWSPPPRGFARQIVQDADIADQAVRTGDRVWFAYNAGNRDPDAFSDPQVFDIARPGNRAHLAFGFGTHACVAAPLVRVEVQLLIERLMQRYPEFEWAGQPRRIETFMRNGWLELPVAFSPGDAVAVTD